MKSMSKIKYPCRLALGLAISAVVVFGAWSPQPAQREIADKLDQYQRLMEDADPIVCGGKYKLVKTARDTSVRGLFAEVEIAHRMTFTNEGGSTVYVDTNSHLYTEAGRVYSQTSMVDRDFVARQLIHNALVDCLGGVK